jgi:AAA domain
MPSNWYVLTGAPGVGKTMLLDELSRRGFAVVPEAATDVIERLRRAGVAEPRTLVDFVDQVLAEQLVRARRADRFGAVPPGDLRPFTRVHAGPGAVERPGTVARTRSSGRQCPRRLRRRRVLGG